MSKKFTQKEVEKLFKENNCELLGIYISARIPVEYRCVCGNFSKISLDNFKKGKRCKQCGLKKLSNQFKHDINYVKQYFINNNCIPLFNEYFTTSTPLKYICECGEIGNTSFSDFQYGKRCGHCRVSRIQNTMYKHGTQQCSLQQKHIHNAIGGELNYPIKNITLDIAFLEEKIYVEYDGSGHDLSVKKGDLTIGEFKEKEKRRNYALYRSGWKEIRIISRRDKLPTDNILTTMISNAKDYLSKNHHWIVYDIDNSIIKNSEGIIKCNFGELQRMRTDNYKFRND